MSSAEQMKLIYVNIGEGALQAKKEPRLPKADMESMSPAPEQRNAPLKPLKWYKKLANHKGRLEAEAFLVEGERAIQQIMGSRPEAILEIITVEGLPNAHPDYSVRVFTESQFRTIASTRTPQGIMAVVRIPAETYSDTLPEHTGTRILLLEDIQ
ncbi:MAG: hypothetical protein ABIB93_06530, partial [Chloroflexota bacterium]